MINPLNPKILRSAHMEESADPLSEAAGSYDTSYPVMAPDQVLPWKVAKAEKKRNEEKGNEYISLKLTLEKEARFKDNKPCRVGFVVNNVIAITPTENYSVEDVKRNLGLWIKAIFGVEKAKSITFRQFVDSPSMADGYILNGKTSIKKASGSFPEGTNVSPIIPAN